MSSTISSPYIILTPHWSFELMERVGLCAPGNDLLKIERRYFSSSFSTNCPVIIRESFIPFCVRAKSCSARVREIFRSLRKIPIRRTSFFLSFGLSRFGISSSILFDDIFEVSLHEIMTCGI